MAQLVYDQRNGTPQVRCDIRTNVCVHRTCYFARVLTATCPVTVCVAVEAYCLVSVPRQWVGYTH
jgi:hypothetical protein